MEEEMALSLPSSLLSQDISMGPRIVENHDPIPLSFPAILRNPGLSDRFPYPDTSKPGSKNVLTVVSKNRRDENGGKRWVRRKENARFLGNPHIVVATKKDYILQPPQIRTTFPEPLPSYLPRNTKVPAATLPSRNSNSANAGRFSLSIKGMRRELRKSGARAEHLVQDIELAITDWLQAGGTVLSPDVNDINAFHSPGTPIGNTQSITEISRTPLQLIWSITNDAFARYVVHCCARYHEVVSYSKDLSGRRLTYLLRPNVVRPDFTAVTNLDTPPVTDLDLSSQIDSESDVVLDCDSWSEAEESDADHAVPRRGILSSIPEMSASLPSHPPASAVLELTNERAWSITRDTDVEGDRSESEGDLAASIDSLSPQGEMSGASHSDPHASLVPVSYLSWRHRQRRSESLSCSPARRPSRQIHLPPNPRSKNHTQRSLYDFLFS